MLGVTVLASAPGTIAFDLRNCPDWRFIAEHRYAAAILSARAKDCGAADSLRARGLRVGYHIQPWLPAWDGAAETTFTLDRTLYRLTSSEAAWLRDSTGKVPLVHEPGITGLPYDYSQLDFARRFGQALAAFDPAADFWYFDYGDMKSGIPWVVSLRRVASDRWPRWAEGYRLVAERARGERVCFYGKGDDFLCPECDVYPFEGVGDEPGDLYGYARTLAMCRAAEREGKAGLIFCQKAQARHRRVLAAIALLTGAWFNWRDFAAPGGFDKNLPDPEHFELKLGAPSDTMRQVAPGVWRRAYQRGFVIANLGEVPYRLSDAVMVAPLDGLAAQTRDASGRKARWLTNQAK